MKTLSPTPWKAVPKGLGNYLIVDANGDFVATTHTDTPKDNGPLLAGAPDLVAALARVLKWQGILAGCRHGVPMSEEDYNKASADFNAARDILDAHS